MPIILMLLLASMSLGSPARAGMVPGSGTEQFTQNCQTGNQRLERLESAIRRGDINSLRTALDQGVDVNETWRDLPPQVCLSLLLRSIWYSQDDIFDLLLKRGADPRSLPRESLGIPVRNGRADLSLSSEVWDNANMRPFNAMDVAVKRKDTGMANPLRKAGAPPGIWGRQPRRVPGVK